MHAQGEMVRFCLAGLRAHAIRTLLTAAAVALGVSLFTGTLIYAATARAAFADDFARPARGVDFAVDPPDSAGFDITNPLPPTVLERVTRLSAVASAHGQMVAPLPMLGRDSRVLQNLGRVGYAMSPPTDDRMSPVDLTTGRWPHNPAEATLDQITADQQGISVGDRITVLDRDDHHRELVVVGTVDPGTSPIFHGWTLLVLNESEITSLTGTRGYASITVAATPGVDHRRLTAELSDAAGPGHTVVTGEQVRADLARDSAKYVAEFAAILLASALVALIIAALVGHNAFAVLAAARAHELGLLRVVGATRAQVLGLMLAEALGVGTAAAGVGVLLGLPLAWGIAVGRDAAGAPEPGHGLVVTGGTIVTAVAVGVLATVAASLVPAIRACRVPPVAALRSTSDQILDSTAHGRARRDRVSRAWIAVLILAGGLAMLARGARDGLTGAVPMAAGAMGVLLAVVVATPLFTAALVRLVGWLPGRLCGAAGRLAVANALRAPTRTAATTGALLVGVAVMAMLSVLVASARDQGERELAENLRIDFVVDAVGTDTRDTLATTLDTRLRSGPEFETVIRTRLDHAWLAGAPVSVSTIAPHQPDTSTEVIAGALADTLIGVAATTPTAAGRMPVAVRTTLAYPRGLALNDPIHLTTFAGTPIDGRVAAIFDDSAVSGDLIIGWPEFTAAFGDRGDQLLLRRSTVSTVEQARAALDQALRDYPYASISSRAERRAQLTDQWNRRLGQFSALLVACTIIAVLGITDALMLAVRERIRELSTLRALGLSRRGLRVTLLIEAQLTAFVAAIVGVSCGTALGWLMSYALISRYGHGLPTLPVGQLVGFAVLASIAASIATIAPARRANRASILAGLAHR